MKIDPISCPCCKKAVRFPSLDIVIDHCKLPPMQARILGALCKGKGQPVQTEMIIAAMDRGLDVKSHTYNDFKIELCRLRRRLKNVGIAIPNVGYAQGYRIVFPEHMEMRKD
ncbi:hypothetical protein [Bradyrhizobium sp. BWA-3-5]|uniref:hypothetical protein n=1 Tax=Bradyrhizobium sp. BWA-3-5 TaxID=3080013 RepID=UPI00293EAFA9|nr:hypothetical protein [Bradyrhizobium sp. BWA-3-5]WOH68663.1 hypothetical protein RX331_13545 [Bradyrhizobium sp. BWA-3-5]